VLVSLVALPASADVPAPVVQLEIVLLGKLGNNAILRDRITSWFEPERFRLHVRSAKQLDTAEVLAPSRDYTLSLWIQLAGTSARLYFAAAGEPSSGARYLVRDLTLENGLDEIGAEHLAEVVHLSALALLEGELATPRQELERKLAEAPKLDAATAREEAAIERELSRRATPPVEARPRSQHVVFGVGYGVAFHSAEGVWHGPRANIGAQLGSALSLFVGFAFGMPQAHDLGPLSLHIEALALSAGARLTRRLSPALALQLSAGPGVEVVHYEPEAGIKGVTLGNGATEARPELASGVGVLLGSGAVRFALVGELAVSLMRTRYELQTSAGPQVVARPTLLLPRAGLELKF
jgi:hypothetical protein